MSFQHSDRWKMLIGGKWVEAENGEVFEDISSIDGRPLWTVPKGTRGDAKRAIEAATEAKKVLADMTPMERARFLYKAADEIEARTDELAEIVTKEMGKPITQAKHDLSRTVAICRSFAEESRRILGEVLPSENKGVWSLVIRIPRGVVAAIAPWNYPYLLSVNKVAAAIITGNTVILKPSSDTPITGIKLGEIFTEAGLPAGAINVVTGPGPVVGDELVRNPGTNVISHTGECATGKEIVEKTGRLFKKICLELGGKAPFMVLKDADVDQAVRSALWATFAGVGQACIAVDRILLAEEVADEFIQKFVEAASTLVIGNPLQPETQIGPLVNKRQRDHVERLVEDALDKGAQLKLGGNRVTENVPQGGFYYQPTILTDATQEMKIMQDEIFGPAVAIVVCKDVDEMVAIANNVKYGLGSSVWTKDLNVALDVAKRLEFGGVRINESPFYDEPHGPHGGIKESGMGREGGRYSIEDYMDYKWITIHTIPRKYPFDPGH